MKAFRILIAGGIAVGFAAGCGDSTPAGEAARGDAPTGDYQGITGSPDADTLPRTQILGDIDTVPTGQQPPPRQ